MSTKQVHEIALESLECFVQEYGNFAGGPYRESLRFAILSLIKTLGFFEDELSRGKILEVLDRIRGKVLTNPDFDEVIVDALNLLAQEPTSDPSEQLARRFGSSRPPADLFKED